MDELYCDEPECDQPARHGGTKCEAHYKRQLRGSTLRGAIRERPQTPAQRLHDIALGYADAETDQDFGNRRASLHKAACAYSDWSRLRRVNGTCPILHRDCYLVRPIEKNPLTQRQQIFVAKYQATGNATQSAIDAGYSPRNAAAIGSRLLRNVKVKAAIQKGTEERVNKLEISANEVLLGLKKIGRLKLPKDSFRGSDKVRALELLGKHLKLFTEQLSLSGGLTLAQLIAGAEKLDQQEKP